MKATHHVFYGVMSLNIDELQLTELRAEAGEVYLFQWLSSLEKSLTDATSVDPKTSQHLEQSVINVLLSPDPFPPPGRPLRNLAARCLILLYKKGETKSLFDTLQLLLKVAGDSKVQDKDVNKVYVALDRCQAMWLMCIRAAFHCIGDLMEVFGSQVSLIEGSLCRCVDGCEDHVIHGRHHINRIENVQILQRECMGDSPYRSSNSLSPSRLSCDTTHWSRCGNPSQQPKELYLKGPAEMFSNT
jgi:hypothetical protein